MATHLQERMPVVLLAEDDAEAERLRAHNPPSNVRVVSLAEHVGSAWADGTTYVGLRASASARSKKMRDKQPEKYAESVARSKRSENQLA